MGKLTTEQVAILIIIERTNASISVIATLILLSTFTFIKDFRTLSNTLIFYASFANLFANVACLIGGSALSDVDGVLCQFQGFLLEMFMQSDPLWSCAMAVNVYLVFFRRFDSERLKNLHWLYGIICYGLPFIPAMFCLFYKNKKNGNMYGNATLWCWIDNDWAAVRIYSYYLPIWISIITAIGIYIAVGVDIWKKRGQLRAIRKNNRNEFVCESSKGEEAPFSGTRTTEIQISTSSLNKSAYLTTPIPVYTSPLRQMQVAEPYSISITSHTPTTPKVPPSTTVPTSSIPVGATHSRKRSMDSIDRIKWGYTGCAILFAMSILVTWVPASLNRVYGLRYPHDPSFALNVGSAVVLPLQGFWNTIIYFSTSTLICRRVWGRWRSGGGIRGRNGSRPRGTNAAEKGVVRPYVPLEVALPIGRNKRSRSSESVRGESDIKEVRGEGTSGDIWRL